VRWALAGLVFLAPLLLVLLIALYPARRILPGVWCIGLNLGGMTRSHATAVLRENWESRTVRLDPGAYSLGGAERGVRPAALGLEIDLETTVEAAFRRGRTLDRLVARTRGEERFYVEPVVIYDAASVREYLSRLKSEIDLEPVSESLRLVDGRVELTPSQPGRALDLDATALRLQGAPVRVVWSERLELVIRDVPAPELDLSAVVEQANAWLSNTLLVEVFDPISGQTARWHAAPPQWGEWVSLRVDPARAQEGDAGLAWDFDIPAAQAALETQMDAWIADGQVAPSSYVELSAAAEAMWEAVMQERWAVHLRAYHYGSRYTVRSGETLSSIAGEVGIPYPWLEQANPGVSDSLSVGQVIQVPSPDVMLPLPVVENKRIVVSISRQRMWAYQDGALIWEWVVSTGIPSSPTAPGIFQVQSHDGTAYASSWDLWMPHFLGIYRPVPSSDFMNGFHGFPTRDGVSLLWTGNLGYPVTYGCILLDTGNAALLYDWAEDGVIVEIQK
jgi:lipoprotein-anchoring transpeptidase ErfK/SrfK